MGGREAEASTDNVSVLFLIIEELGYMTERTKVNNKKVGLKYRYNNGAIELMTRTGNE